MIHALLTIDDVPAKILPAMVDCLTERGIRAILFAVGSSIDRYPAQAACALEHGMILGNHSDTHPHFGELSFHDAVREIEACEEKLDRLYRETGVARLYRPFRFPYGDKGGENREAMQRYLKEKGFSKVRDDGITWPRWRENGMDREIDTFWTFDFGEYRIRPGSGFTMDDVFCRMEDPDPEYGAPLYRDGSCHILLLHAHDETEALVPDYYRTILDRLTERGVRFVPPEFKTL